MATERSRHLFSRTAGSEPCWYRLGYNLVSLVMFFWVMSAYRSSPVLYFAPGIWSLVLYGVQTMLLFVLASCIRLTGFNHFAGLSQLRSDELPASQLITHGWYGFVRHPLYLFSTLFLLLNPVMTGQWLLLTVMSLIYFIIGGVVEERRLIKQFGDTYRQYQRRVPFMIPAVPRRKRRDYT